MQMFVPQQKCVSPIEETYWLERADQVSLSETIQRALKKSRSMVGNCCFLSIHTFQWFALFSYSMKRVFFSSPPRNETNDPKSFPIALSKSKSRQPQAFSWTDGENTHIHNRRWLFFFSFSMSYSMSFGTGLGVLHADQTTEQPNKANERRDWNFDMSISKLYYTGTDSRSILFQKVRAGSDWFLLHCVFCYPQT